MNLSSKQDHAAGAAPDDTPVELSIKGSPAYLQRFFAAMARMAADEEVASEPPTPILLTRSEACALLRCSPDTISSRVRAGTLTNYGGAGKMMLSKAQLMEGRER